jgi:ABC-type sugar transport system substrate-binding protein
MKHFVSYIKKRTLFNLLIVLFISVFTTLSCGNQQKQVESTKETASKKPRIALIMKSLANEFFKTME